MMARAPQTTPTPTPAPTPAPAAATPAPTGPILDHWVSTEITSAPDESGRVTVVPGHRAYFLGIRKRHVTE
jgi:hypothetical protein